MFLHASSLILSKIKVFAIKLMIIIQNLILIWEKILNLVMLITLKFEK